MTTIKKHISKLLLALTALIAIPAHAYPSYKALGLGFTATTIGLAVMNEELTESEWFEKLSDKINIDKDDLAPCLVFGSALWAASYLPDGTTARTVLRVGALLPALAAACLPKKAINKLAQLPGIKQYFALMKSAKGLPLIGDMAQCSQLGCEGLCHKCKARKFYLTVPLAGIPFLPTIWGSLKETVSRWERERLEESARMQDERMRKQRAQEDRAEGALHTAQHNHYITMGIEQNIDVNDINQKYRRAALLCHPDRAAKNGMTPAQANAQTARLNHANEVLSDPIRKAAYDTGLQEGIEKERRNMRAKERANSQSQSENPA